MNCFYCGIEPLVERYSYQLEEWNRREFERLGVPLIPVYGEQITKTINVGSVLDAYGRTHYSMTQMANLVRMIRDGQITEKDVIFFEDMFTPGIESLPYIFCQTNEWPRVFVRCLAQTIDPDDFVHRTDMVSWMRNFERIVDDVCVRSKGGILVASEEMVPMLRVAEFKAPIHVTGLPFGKQEVLERATPLSWADRKKTVVFAARWDSEKQPEFFLEVAKLIHTQDKDVEFKILTGASELRSNDRSLLSAFAASDAPVEALTGLSKNAYYAELAEARVLFNCALQDWVSNTVSEADALGCMTIYPAYRSFPEVFANNPAHMYLPWSVEDAAEKVMSALNSESAPASIGLVSNYQDRTIQRTIEVFKGERQHSRNRRDYRKHVGIPKY